MKRDTQTHYLPHNKITWSPPTVVFVKPTLTATTIDGAEVLTLVGWVATMVHRRNLKVGQPDRRTGWGIHPESLAEWVTESTRGRDTVWLFLHNPALDLSTTRLPLTLHALGWKVNEASLVGSAPWLRLAKGSRRLCIASSFSYLPHRESDLAERLGEPKPARRVDEPSPEWAARSARSDLDTITRAMLDLLDWWDKHELGKWSITGTSTGWHAMRHLPNPHKLVIDPDPVRIAADRKAIYGGRRGAWVIGTRSLGPFLELDFTNAYPSVAAGLPLPNRRGAAFSSMALDNWRLTSERWGIIAEVDIMSTVPRWPVRFPGGTFCPVGSFRTTLAGPEIRDALRLGCLLRVGPGITHQLGYYLAPWGNWVIGVIRNTDDDTPVAAQLAAKHWSRGVIGRTASRSYERVDLGPSPIVGWGYEEGWDHATQTRCGTIHLAGEQWQSVVDGDAEQSYPAIFGWVESETRVRLTRTIEAVGEGAVLQCDTDGLIVAERILGTKSARGHLRAPAELVGAARTKWVLDQLDPIIAPLTIRVKRKHQTIQVLGPQHLKSPGYRKMSGVPGLAEERTPDAYTFNTWPGLPYQLSHGSDQGYVRPERTVRIQGPYAPGWVLTDGRVIPPECTIRDDGTNRLLGWDEMTIKPKRARRAAEQHPVLAALW